MSDKPEILTIPNVDIFAAVISAWHKHQISVLEHLLQLPPGTKVSVDDGEDIVMEGDILRGFTIGLHVAMIELGTLPFVADPVQEEIPTSDEQVPIQ